MKGLPLPAMPFGIRLAVILALSLAGPAWAQQTPAQPHGPVAILLAAEAAHERIPLISTFVTALDVAGAMEIQRHYVKKSLGSGRLAGFKAGLTAPKAQERFGLAGPVAGVLFQCGKMENHSVVGSSAFHRLVVETEIGFVLNRAIDREMESVSAVKAAVREVRPVIELPDLGFADMNALQGVDIIAANVSSRKFILGAAVPVNATDLNTLDMVLYRDGEAVNRGRGSDALGDQWQALLWLANTMIGQGYVLEPGQVLITGALGKMVPGKAGRYRAVYGTLGTVAFDIR